MLWNTLNLNRKTMQTINVQQKMFDMAETVDECYKHLVNRTCRQCANRQTWQAQPTMPRHQICTARRDNRTVCGYARCRVNQPACILFELKQNTKTL